MTRNPFNDFLGLLPQLPDALEGVVSARSVYAQVEQRLSLWQGHEPSLGETHICLFAATHEHGESVNVVKEKLNATMHGRAEVNQLCKENGIGLRVLELAVEMPVASPRDKALFTAQETMAGIAFGMEAAAAGGDLLCLGEMASGTELGCRLIISEINEKKISPLEALSNYGGREVAAMVGGIVAARAQQLPVLLDGWAALAAATILHAIDSKLINHTLSAYSSSKEQEEMWVSLGLYPLMQPEKELADGVGAAAAVNLLYMVLKLKEAE